MGVGYLLCSMSGLCVRTCPPCYSTLDLSEDLGVLEDSEPLGPELKHENTYAATYRRLRFKQRRKCAVPSYRIIND